MESIANVLSDEVEKIEIFISCRSLKDADTLSKSNPYVVLSVKGANEAWIVHTRTETIKHNLNPNFVKTVVIDYYFEKQQHVKLEVFCDEGDGQAGELIGSVNSSIGAMVGAKQQTSVLDLVNEDGKNTGKIVLRAEKVVTCREFVIMKWSGSNIKDTRYFCSKTCPFLRFYRKPAIGPPLLVHQTEHLKNELNPVFQEFQINLGKLSGENKSGAVLVELWDYEDSGSHTYIGEFQFTVDVLTSGDNKQYKVVNSKNGGKSNENLGVFTATTAKVVDKPRFLDFIRGGTQLALMIAIDFTGSNGNPNTETSLHSIHPNAFNQYQAAIRSVGEILLNYDHDKKVPVYGFGGKPTFPNLTSPSVLHCFPLTGSAEQPEVNGMEGIMNVYNFAIRNCELSGPTIFNPLLKETIKVCQAAKQEQIKNPATDQYYILLILTDGDISDMQESIKCVISSWNLPLSIIIVGVGQGDFTKMDTLDGDDGLWDHEGNKAKRDLVQFVPFAQYKSNPTVLAEKVLEELPTQLEEYMEMVGRKPQPPQQHMNLNISQNQMSYRAPVDINSINFAKDNNNNNQSFQQGSIYQ